MKERIKPIITTCTPLRISLAGGGTDTPVYFERHTGLVVSMTINQYVAVSIIRQANDPVLESEWIHNHLRVTGLHNSGMKVGVDYPCGSLFSSGLAMSSAFSVGLLNALFQYKGEPIHPAELAEYACELNINAYGRTGVGFQDEYACAHGGLNAITFASDGVIVERLADSLGEQIADMLMLFKLPMVAKQADEMMLRVNHESDKSTTETIRHDLKALAISMRGQLYTGVITPSFVGDALDSNWNLKKQLTPEMSNPTINRLYDRARDAGAIGGKVCGSGGGGYLLVCSDPQHHSKIRQSLVELSELHFVFEGTGTK